MKIFTEKMDIINIFKKIMQNDKNKNNHIIITMSEECKKQIENIEK